MVPSGSLLPAFPGVAVVGPFSCRNLSGRQLRRIFGQFGYLNVTFSGLQLGFGARKLQEKLTISYETSGAVTVIYYQRLCGDGW